MCAQKCQNIQNIQTLKDLYIRAATREILWVDEDTKNPNNHARKPLAYVQTKPNETTAWFRGL